MSLSRNRTIVVNLALPPKTLPEGTWSALRRVWEFDQHAPEQSRCQLIKSEKLVKFSGLPAFLQNLSFSLSSPDRWERSVGGRSLAISHPAGAFGHARWVG